VRYKTAAILSTVVVAGLIGVPFVMKAALAPYLKHNLPIPGYLKLFFDFCLFLLAYRWLLAPAIVAVLSLIAALTKESPLKKSDGRAAHL
jgi:hypothetical protein